MPASCASPSCAPRSSRGSWGGQGMRRHRRRAGRRRPGGRAHARVDPPAQGAGASGATRRPPRRRSSGAEAAGSPSAWARRRCCARPPSASGKARPRWTPTPAAARTWPPSAPPTAQGYFSESMFVRFALLATERPLEGPDLWLIHRHRASTGSPRAPTADHRVVVVGAGIGGLVSALLLACRGLQVTLVEAAADARRQDAAGGGRRRAHRRRPDRVHDALGVRRDPGRGRQLARRTGARCSRCRCWRATPGAADGHAQLDLYRRPCALGRRHRRSSPARPRRAASWPSAPQARRVYARSKARTSVRQRPACCGMIRDLGPRGLATLAGLGPFATPVGARSATHFHDPRLRQLFGRYATYCGASPWQAPATLMLVAQVEHRRRLVGATAACTRWRARWRSWRASAAPRCATARPAGASLVRDGRACGVQLADGARAGGRRGGLQRRRERAGATACSATTRSTPRRRAGGRRRSLSAVTWAMHTRTAGLPLVRHNVFFDDDYRQRVRRHLPRTAGCRATARSTSARRTAATTHAAPAGPSACCASSTPRPTATAAPSTPWRPTHASTAAWPCCATAACRSSPTPDAGGAHHAGGLPPALSRPRAGRCTARRRTAGCRSFSRPGSAQRAAGPVPGGGQRAPGAGRADGGDVGPAGGRDADGAPRFDQPVAVGWLSLVVCRRPQRRRPARPDASSPSSAASFRPTTPGRAARGAADGREPLRAQRGAVRPRARSAGR